MLNTKFKKVPPKVIKYWDYCKFSEAKFFTDLSNVANREIPGNYDNFESLIEGVLERHAPTKKATIRGNNKRHVSNELEKEIIHRSRLKILQIKVVKGKIFGVQTAEKQNCQNEQISKNEILSGLKYV